MTNAISENFQRKMAEAFAAMQAEEQKREEERQKLQEFLQSQLINKSINNAELDEAESARLMGALNTRKEMFEKFRKEASKTPKELFDEYRQSQVTQGKSVKNKIMRFLDSMAYYQRGGDAVAYQKSQDLYDRNRKFLNTELKEEEKTLKEIEADLNKRKTTNVKMDLDAQKAEATRVSQIVAAIQRAMAMRDNAAVEKYKAELANAKVPLEIQQLLAGIASKYSSDNALAFGLNSGSVPQSVMQNRENVLAQKELIKQKYAPQMGITEKPDKYGQVGIDDNKNPVYGWFPGGQQRTKIPLDRRFIQQEMDRINGQAPQVPQQPMPQLPPQPGMPPQQPPIPQNPMAQPRAQIVPQPQMRSAPKVQEMGTKYAASSPSDKFAIEKAPPKLDPFGRPMQTYTGVYKSSEAARDASNDTEFSGSLSSTLNEMAGAFTTPSSKGTTSVADEIFGSLFNNPNSQNNIGTFSQVLSLIKDAVQKDPGKVYKPEDIQDLYNRFMGKWKDGTPEKQFANRIVPSMTKSIMNYVVKQSGKQINEQELKLYQSMFANIISDTSQSAFERMLNFSSKMLMTSKLKKAGYGLMEISALMDDSKFNTLLYKKINDMSRRAAGTLGSLDKTKKFDVSEVNPTNILGEIMEEGNFELPGGGKIVRMSGGKPPKNTPSTRRTKDELREMFSPRRRF